MIFLKTALVMGQIMGFIESVFCCILNFLAKMVIFYLPPRVQDDLA